MLQAWFEKKTSRVRTGLKLTIDHVKQLPAFQAPATRLKRIASAAIDEAKEQGAWKVSAALRKAGDMKKDNLKNAERDLHLLFSKSDLTLPFGLSMHKFGLLYVHYFQIKSWFEFLLQSFSPLLFGGFRKVDAKTPLLLESFWSAFRQANSDHWVFDYHGDRLHRCIPFHMHLDEGTGLRKSAVLIINIQALFGQDTATKFEKIFLQGSGRGHDDMLDYMTRAQTHNQRGSSLLSRFLYTLIPKRWYTKAYGFVYDRLLDKLATEIRGLAEDGVGGYWPICLGVKGDAPALAKAGHLNRTFASLAHD